MRLNGVKPYAETLYGYEGIHTPWCQKIPDG